MNDKYTRFFPCEKNQVMKIIKKNKQNNNRVKGMCCIVYYYYYQVWQQHTQQLTFMFSVCIVFYLFFLVEDWHTQRWLMVKAVGWRFARSNLFSTYYRYLVFNPLCLSLFGEINSCSTLLFFSLFIFVTAFAVSSFAMQFSNFSFGLIVVMYCFCCLRGLVPQCILYCI